MISEILDILQIVKTLKLDTDCVLFDGIISPTAFLFVT